MGARWRHFRVVCRHKYQVFKQCKSCGLWKQGILHDMSKFSITEFSASARYFQGHRSPIEAEKEDVGYSAAWLHHKGHNRHHWEYWTDFDDNGDVIANKIPLHYVIEMICDWIGAGKVYAQDKQWSPLDMIDYYNSVRKARYFHPDTEAIILKYFDIIINKGMADFYQCARTDIHNTHHC